MEKMKDSLTKARSMLLEMFRIAIDELTNASECIKNGKDASIGDKMKLDDTLDGLYEETERGCFKILLLEAPFATDFRKVSAILKMITDLERIGDYAVDILEECTYAENPLGVTCPDLVLLADYVTEALKRSFYAFMNEDLQGARDLEKEDDKIDALFAIIKKAASKKDSPYRESIAEVALVAKFLERMGDHVVNLGEWIDYGLTGTHLIS